VPEKACFSSRKSKKSNVTRKTLREATSGERKVALLVGHDWQKILLLGQLLVVLGHKLSPEAV